MTNKQIYLNLAHISGNEQKFIDEAFRTNCVAPSGPNVDGFEKRPTCFVAAANPIKYVGATPVFIDSEPLTWNMSPELLEPIMLKKRFSK